LNTEDDAFRERWRFPIDEEAKELIDKFDRLKEMMEPLPWWQRLWWWLRGWWS
jgi:hypothetical protein